MMGLFDSFVRDLAFTRSLLPVLLAVKRRTLDDRETIADYIERWAATTPDRIAIVFEGRDITWREYDSAANRWARWALAQGLGKGDVVALMIANRPEFLFAWAGLAKVGVVSALINTNLSGQPLAHSLRISGARHLAADAEYADQLASALPMLETPPRVWTTGGDVEGHEGLDRVLAGLPGDPLDKAARPVVTGGDNLFYIYTSGTTGNPKAANFSHMRTLQAASASTRILDATASDRMYVVLPLYHSAGGVLAVGTMLIVGGTIVLRRRFSASEFWDDCARTKATLFQYIGELCRYLNNAPPHPLERSHSLRTVIGNGLRPEIWEAFQTRFAIPRIVEFYAATEGNVTLVNLEGKVGAVGRIPRWLEGVMKVRLVRFDVEAEQPVRGPDGLCIACAPGEVGEAIGFIPADPKVNVGRFEGYKGEEETRRKILRDVFEKGDSWFRTGDLMRRDAQGYFYFVDRIGDTFRWKGENVATSEVAEVLSVFPGIKEANVYGVAVPGADGRAGMAAIVADQGLDLAALARHLDKHLASYAVPLFLRFRREIEITGTFKHRKVDLAREGFDPARVEDQMFFRDPATRAYVPLEAELHAQIVAGNFRL
jgi:fatty-acyl-CoA synthase